MIREIVFGASILTAICGLAYGFKKDSKLIDSKAQNRKLIETLNVIEYYIYQRKRERLNAEDKHYLAGWYEGLNGAEIKIRKERRKIGC